MRFICVNANICQIGWILGAALFGIQPSLGEAKFESRGPLVRYDPHSFQLKGLTGILGSPRVGHMGYVKEVSRIRDQNKWYLKANNGIQVMGLGQSGVAETIQFIEASGQWTVSFDESHLFASRTHADASGRVSEVMECFSLKDGKSLWVWQNADFLIDAAFTPDGLQVILLHAKREGSVGVECKVTCIMLRVERSPVA